MQVHVCPCHNVAVKINLQMDTGIYPSNIISAKFVGQSREKFSHKTRTVHILMYLTKGMVVLILVCIKWNNNIQDSQVFHYRHTGSPPAIQLGVCPPQCAGLTSG